MKSRPWTVPKLWRGETAVVLATGPSMSQNVADAVRGRARAIAVNDAFRLAPWADVLYAADWQWWRHHADNALKFAGLKVTVGFHCPYPEVLALCDGGFSGFDNRPTHLRTGKNSGYQAVHLAAHLGAKRILLCGFDMRESKRGPSHFFGDHPRELRNEPIYETFRNYFERAAPEYRNRGIEVINCTPGSALKCFPMQSLEEALEGVSADSRPSALSA